MNLAVVLVALAGVGCFKADRTEPSAEPAPDLSMRSPQSPSVDAASSCRDSPEVEAPPRQIETDPLSEKKPSKVIVYYFHRTLRCPSCLAIESYTQKTIRRDFADALGDGRLEWRIVNIDQADNKHFEDDFRLVTQAVVLVELTDGEMTRWKNLEQVWDLLDDEVAFQEYIAEEVWEFLGG